MASPSKEAKEQKRKVDSITQKIRDGAFRARERGDYDKALPCLTMR